LVNALRIAGTTPLAVCVIELFRPYAHASVPTTSGDERDMGDLMLLAMELRLYEAQDLQSAAPLDAKSHAPAQAHERITLPPPIRGRGIWGARLNDRRRKSQ